MVDIFSATWIASVFVASLAAGIYGWLWWHFSIFARIGITGPKPTFIIGNLKELLKQGHLQTLIAWHAQYGDVFGYYEGYTPVLVVADADIAKQITIKDFYDYFPNRKPFPLAPRKSNTLFLARGLKWKRIRNTVTPAFSGARMKQMSPIISQCVSELLDNLELKADTGEMFDANENFQQLTLDVIARCALGLHFTAQQHPEDEYLNNIRDLLVGLGVTKILPFVMVFPFLSHFIFALSSLLTLFGRTNPVQFLMSQMRHVIKQRKESPNDGSRYIDLLDLMLNVEVSSTEAVHDFVAPNHDLIGKPLHGEGITVDEMISQSVVFLLAGFETTSAVISYVTHALVNNEGIQDKLREEIDELIKPGEEINYDVVKRLPYMEKVFNEICRLYPTAGLLVQRQAIKDWRYKGLFIPKNMYINIHVWGIHYNPKYWDNPTVFDPERFSKEGKAKQHSFAYLPFGAGPRNCVGRRFGIMEAKMTVVKMLQNYTFHRCEKTQREMKFHSRGAVVPRDGIHVTITRRDTSDNG